MYEQFFDLREAPFSLTPDPRFLWLSETHREGLALLYHGITTRQGFVMLTGEIGAGKTTLLRTALERVPEEIETGLVLNTADLEPRDLLKLIVQDFQIPGSFDSKADYLIAINQFLLERLRRRSYSVLIVDEAQNLGLAALEELRLLSNLETSTGKLLLIVLAGQPELRVKLADPSLVQLRQRISLDHHVTFLGREEVVPYLRHRIEVAGGRYEDVFLSDCDEVLFDYSCGCPRLLNVLADHALRAAFAQGVRPVTRPLLTKRAREVASLQAQRRLELVDSEG